MTKDNKDGPNLNHPQECINICNFFSLRMFQSKDNGDHICRHKFHKCNNGTSFSSSFDTMRRMEFPSSSEIERESFWDAFWSAIWKASSLVYSKSPGQWLECKTCRCLMPWIRLWCKLEAAPDGRWRGREVHTI